jgi:hypothetical protein
VYGVDRAGVYISRLTEVRKRVMGLFAYVDGWGWGTGLNSCDRLTFKINFVVLMTKENLLSCTTIKIIDRRSEGHNPHYVLRMSTNDYVLLDQTTATRTPAPSHHPRRVPTTTTRIDTTTIR